MSRVCLFLAVVFAALLGGCATYSNVKKPKPEIFGGLTMSSGDFFGRDQGGALAAATCEPIWLIDKPFSLVGDTITLPYVLGKRLWWGLANLDNPNLHGDANLEGDRLYNPIPRAPDAPERPESPSPSPSPTGADNSAPPLVGLTVAEASGIATGRGWKLQVVGDDQVTAAVACTGRRIEVHVKDGMISSQTPYEQ